MVKFLLVALSGGALAAVPSVSPTYQIEVKWSAQVPSLKKTYTYQETHFYDIKTQQARLDSREKTLGLVMSTIDLPRAEKETYQMDWQTKTCDKWSNIGAITGFVTVTPDMKPTTGETMDGVKCTRYTRVETSPPGKYEVWLAAAAPHDPVAVFSSDWVEAGDTITDGIKHISHFNATLPTGVFDYKGFPATCAAAPKPIPGTCHAVSASVTDKWCQANCHNDPPNCPSSLCKCK